MGLSATLTAPQGGNLSLSDVDVALFQTDLNEAVAFPAVRSGSFTLPVQLQVGEAGPNAISGTIDGAFPAPLTEAQSISPSLVATWIEAAADQPVSFVRVFAPSYHLSIVFEAGTGPSFEDFVETWDEAALVSFGGTVNGLDLGPGETGQRLVGTGEADALTGGGGDDTLIGKGGADDLRGGAGADQQKGGAGRDQMRGGTGEDTLLGGKGQDTLRGERGDDQISGGKGADDLSGGADDDLLKGGSGEDTLQGGSGADTLQGGAGADLLIDSPEDDVMTGGSGRDMFLFLDPDLPGSDAGGRDQITDFDAARDEILVQYNAVEGLGLPEAGTVLTGFAARDALADAFGLPDRSREITFSDRQVTIVDPDNSADQLQVDFTGVTTEADFWAAVTLEVL